MSTAFVSVALAVSSAHAFKPNEDGHLGITTTALSPISRTADNEEIGFSERALDEIRDANRNTDIITFFGVAEHFDDEAFRASSERLITLKERTIAKALAGDGEGAREDFGGALHTLQDFYSHSNWVELGMTTIEPNLGRFVIQSLPLGEATCGPDAATLVGAGLENETTGYFPFLNPCAIGEPPEATPVGKCRHGVEFFCPEGLNKDAPGRVGFLEARALAIRATVDYAEQVLDDPRIATNGAALRTLMGTEATDGSVLVIEAGLDGGEPKLYDVPVDSTIERIEFEATVLGLDALRPDGQPVQAGEPGVTIIDDAGSRKIAIDAPAAGLWQARLPQGKGQFTLHVAATSDLQIDEFAFVTFTGRPGHEGYVSISDQPKRDSTALALGQIAGPIADVSFTLVDPKGKTIQGVTLADGDPNASATELLGLVTIPKESFRFVMNGVDDAGTAFQRTFPVRFDPRK